MEPPTNAQSLSPILPLANDNLLHRMKALPRLHLKENKLVPTRRYTLARDCLGLGIPLLTNLRWIQLKRAAPLCLPDLVVREGHVEDVGDATGADDVVVVEQVAAFGVVVHGHVLFAAGEGAAACDGLHEGAEFGGVEGVAQDEEVGEEVQLGFGEVGERGEVSSLVHLHTPAQSSVPRRP